MKLITKKILLFNLTNRFRSEYRKNTRLKNGKDSDSTLKELEAETELTEEKVIAIMGHNSWIKNVCNECKQSVDVVMEFEYEYDQVSICVCVPCLKKAIEFAESNL